MEHLSERVKRLIESFYETNPYVRHLRMRLAAIDRGAVKIAMTISPQTHTNVYRVAHGGALASVADTAMGAACLTLDKKVVTIEINMNCLKPVGENLEIFAVSRILHNGSKTIVAECDIMDGAGILYAKSRGTFFVIEKFTD